MGYLYANFHLSCILNKDLYIEQGPQRLNYETSNLILNSYKWNLNSYKCYLFQFKFFDMQFFLTRVGGDFIFLVVYSQLLIFFSFYLFNSSHAG